MNKVCSSALFCAVFCAAMAFGQNASVSGTVTDPSGAQVAGATITATNADTGAVSLAKSNNAGVYGIAALPRGTYTFTGEHPGFRKVTIANVILDVGAQVSVNMGLELGQTTETVEVQATATEVNATSATIGDVVTGKKLLDLPLTGRSAYNLLTTQPGVTGSTGTNFYINGNQGNSINYTMDGINSQNNLLTGSFFNYSNVVTVDRAEEVRVVTSPADAEFGRGAGQVQMVTRSGSNAFHGSAFYEHRNTWLNANNFFNNAQGRDAGGNILVGRPILIQNNYGVRMGGYVKKNKTFFNGIWEPYKQRGSPTFTATVLTAAARAGNFRFIPGVQNQNAGAGTPTVDANGNPLNPSAVQTASLYGRDPNRLTADPTGAVAHNLALIPLPNNFKVGDGLNTAGFIWNRPVPINFELYEGRIDHLFSDKHRIALVATQQSFHSINVAAPPPYPGVPWQVNPTETTSYSATFISVLRSNLINEAKFGAYRPRTLVLTPFDETPVGPFNNKGLLNVSNKVPYVLNFGTVTNPVSGQPSNYIAPVYQFGDSMTWIKGRHSFKGGVEVRLISDSGFDADNVTPRVQLGANGLQPVSGISTIAGIGTNFALAQNLLYDLSGTVTAALMVNNSPGGPNAKFLAGETRFREWHQNEYSYYFKDDFKVTSSLTLNLGVRYELYAAPYEGQGKALAPVGGGGGAFGVSGNTFATGEFHPGVLSGTLSTIQNIGAGTPNPGVSLYQTDRNNFAPALGFAWSLPGEGRLKWLTGGKDKTVIRAGYGVGYERLPIYMTHVHSGFEPGFASTDTSFTATNISTLTLPVPPVGVPLSIIPLSGPGSHSQALYAFAQDIRTPYTQNYNLSVQRSLPKGFSLNVGFVGSKGTKLPRSVNVNEANIFENGLLAGFNAVQAGGTSPLLDQIFGSYPAVVAAGGASNFLRSTAPTNAFFANNNPGGLANYINTTQALSGVVGGLVGRAGLPSNFVVANPQFLTSYLASNFGNSTYNSLQVTVNKRFARGFTFQASYVWSKALGEEEGDSSTYQASYRTLRNMRQDKHILGFNRTSVLKANSIYELPFGKGKTFGKNANGFVDRIIGGWQIGVIYNNYSGPPISLLGQNTINDYALGGTTVFTPTQVGPLPPTSVTRLGGSVTLFPGTSTIVDPTAPRVAGGVATSLRAVTDASGKPLLVNPAAGQLGNTGLTNLTGPGLNSVNVNLIKRIRINERFTAQIEATADNLTNTVQFAAPTTANLSVNSINFGRITGTAAAARLIVLQGRINF